MGTGMTKLIIKENNINWLEIIELAFKRQDWGKNHILFVYGDVTVSCIMHTFDFARNIATFKITCKYEEDELQNEWNNYYYLDYFLGNFTVEEFKRLILKKTINKINEIIKDRTLRKARREYTHLYFTESDINDELKTKYNFIEDYENIENISNESLKEKCIDTIDEDLLELANNNYLEQIERYCSNNEESTINLNLLLKSLNKKVETVEL